VVLTVSVLLVLPSPVRSYMPFVAVALVATAAAVALVVSWWERARNAVMADIRDALLQKNALAGVMLTTILAVVGYAVIFLIAARTVGVTASVTHLLPLALLAILAMVLPSIAGWGPREGATAWVFSAAGLGADRGAATAVAYGVMVLVASLPGGLMLAAGWLPRPAIFRSEGAADA
jgi:uncharacterized membrane protein YbhN (UPF0104 family)